MNQRLVNQTAFLMARALLGQLKDMMKPDDHRMAFEFLFDTCKDGLELYETERERMERRLRPLGRILNCEEDNQQKPQEREITNQRTRNLTHLHSTE